MARWTIRLLGPPQLVLRGRRNVRVPLSPACWSVIGYLIAHDGNEVPRRNVAASIWPDQDEDSAKHCLATTIWRFKEAIKGHGLPIRISAGSLSLIRPLWTDHAAFERRASRLQWGESGPPLARLRRAARLYRGPFLEGHDFEWLQLERERLHCRYLDTLYELANAEVAAGNWAAVISVARRLCQLEPLREDCHRLLMDAYARSGNRASALAQYCVCATTLERELAVEPSDETRALARRIAGRAVTNGANAPLGARLDELKAALVASDGAIQATLRLIDTIEHKAA